MEKHSISSITRYDVGGRSHVRRIAKIMDFQAIYVLDIFATALCEPADRAFPKSRRDPWSPERGGDWEPKDGPRRGCRRCGAFRACRKNPAIAIRSRGACRFRNALSLPGRRVASGAEGRSDRFEAGVGQITNRRMRVP